MHTVDRNIPPHNTLHTYVGCAQIAIRTSSVGQRGKRMVAQGDPASQCAVSAACFDPGDSVLGRWVKKLLASVSFSL